jgi:integrase
MEWIKSSPAKSFKPPKVNEQEIVPFTEDEVKKVLKACDSFKGTNRKSLKALRHLMLASGLRIGDAVMISKKTTVKERQGCSLALRTEKTGATVTCPLPNDVAKDVLALNDHENPWVKERENPHWRSGMGISRSGQAIAMPRTARHIGGSPFPSHSNRPACPAIRINSRIPLLKGCLSRECRLEQLHFFLGHRKVAIRKGTRWVTERQTAVDAAVRGS